MNEILSGSYKQEDIIFLLKNIGDTLTEQSNEERELSMQNGIHYSKMLPIEYCPSDEYLKLFYSNLDSSKVKLAYLVSVLSEKIIKDKPSNLVLVSLARAGSPIGILVKRYLKYKYNLDVPHYSISIIRDIGIDKNAIFYILNNHPNCSIQFVDGWTGKGVIQRVLIESCEDLSKSFNINLDNRLAVLADPSYCTELYATREDFLIPSACLNSTVSGLVSRTVYNEDILSPTDFHGAKFYEHLKKSDVSNLFIDTITDCFSVVPFLDESITSSFVQNGNDDIIISPIKSKGLQDIEAIGQYFNISNINHIKPGVGETTRVLLRRVPWKILIKESAIPKLGHILKLVQDRKVEIEIFNDMSYSCCGIIKDMLGDY